MLRTDARLSAATLLGPIYGWILIDGGSRGRVIEAIHGVA